MLLGPEEAVASIFIGDGASGVAAFGSGVGASEGSGGFSTGSGGGGGGGGGGGKRSGAAVIVRSSFALIVTGTVNWR